MPSPLIQELWTYPVKSLGGIRLQEARLGIEGIEADRMWAVTAGTGEILTQRDLPAMATIRLSLDEERLTLSTAQGDPLRVSLRSARGAAAIVSVWGSRCEVTDEGDAASRWLTSVLGSWRGGELHLVRFDEGSRRSVDPERLGDGRAFTRLADAYPYLITATASLELLSQRLTEQGCTPIAMTRFRPNIVLEGTAPFEEERLASVVAAAGGVQFDLMKRCKRCSVTMVDQTSGERTLPAGEPLRTLASLNDDPNQKGAYFGMRAILATGAGTTLRRGDPVTIHLR
ncbi:MAG: MOSC N-terminal beta barrel domain-containing protein [Planctomycetota bacterium]